jgi:hypothetical protein
MNEIDALTLKLLTSKKRYNNYLANANPEKSAEIQEYYGKVLKNTERIKRLIGKYLENPETETNNEIDDMMENCFRTLLKHFDMQDYEDKCAKHGFDAVDSSEEEEEGEKEEEEEEEEAEDVKKQNNSSFWGKKVNKTSIHGSLDKFVTRRSNK